MDYEKETVMIEGNCGDGSGGEDGAALCFEDEGLVPAAMRALNMMRKNRHFCDVVLYTGCTEVPAHRAVLASASPYLMELFTADQDRGGSSAVVLPLSYKLSGPCERKALLSLVDYAYTGKLSVPAHQVKSVYLCAWQLRMDEVVKRCGRFLAGAWLSRDSCLAVRALPGLAGTARANVDKYIAENFSLLYKSSSLSALPLVQVEVLYTSKRDMDRMDHPLLAELMLHWLRDQITDEQAEMNSMVGRTHLLYLACGGGLKDCAALPPAHSDTPLLQDYRRMLLKCPSKNGKKNGNGHSATNVANGGRSSAVFSRDIVERAHRAPGDDWSVIVSEKLAEHTFLSLCTLDGHLALISASLRLNESPLPSPLTGPLTAVPLRREASEGAANVTAVALPLSPLDRPRCAHGIAVLNGKIIVCGGYDRVECLNSVESYDPELNRWTQLPDMRQQRGRFNIAQVGERIYAVGGSDGHVELDSVEMYQAPPEDCGDSSGRSMSASLESQSGSIEDATINNGPSQQQARKKAWSKRSKLSLARSYAGVCGGPEGLVYCVGGWAGQAGVRDCQLYSSAEDKWSEMPPLNTGRYQAGVCVWGGALWAVGGCNAWHCLATTELFSDLNPSNTSEPGDWHFGPSLSVARRGCGVTAWANKLACAGGSDGQHSLRSVELLAAGAAGWEPGPPLREPRAGLGLAALGDRLYAVGGYSGKVFLSSIEYLADGMEEWTSFTTPFPSQPSFERGTSPPRGDQSIASTMAALSIVSRQPNTNGLSRSPMDKNVDHNGDAERQRNRTNAEKQKKILDQVLSIGDEVKIYPDEVKILNGDSNGLVSTKSEAERNSNGDEVKIYPDEVKVLNGDSNGLIMSKSEAERNSNDGDSAVICE